MTAEECLIKEGLPGIEWVISGGLSGTLAVRVPRDSLVHAEPRKRGGLKAIDDATQAFPEHRSAES